MKSSILLSLSLLGTLYTTGDCLAQEKEANPPQENIAFSVPYSVKPESSSLSSTYIDANPQSSTHSQHFTLDTIIGKGKPVILNFWEPWCSPCIEEMPNFEAVSHIDDVLVYGFSSQYEKMFEPEEQKKYGNAALVLAQVTYPFAGLQQDSKAILYLLSQFSIDTFSYPTTVVFASSGKLDGVYRGNISRKELDEIIVHAKQ